MARGDTPPRAGEGEPHLSDTSSVPAENSRKKISENSAFHFLIAVGKGLQFFRGYGLA